MKKPRIKERYNYIVNGNHIAAGAKFAGNWVWGYAKCHPEDKYDENFGKSLAAARCNQKIAELRYKRAMEGYRRKYNELMRAQATFDGACDYLGKAYDLTKQAQARLTALADELAARDGLYYAGECAHDCF